jgi:hypothetical protein
MNNTNPWVVRESRKQAAIPVGSYIAEFRKVADFNNPKINGTKWKWEFPVVAGTHSGSIAEALTERDISPDTHAGRLVEGMLGRAVQPGEDVRAVIQACAGKRYLVTVAPGSQGGKPAVRKIEPVPPI